MEVVNKTKMENYTGNINAIFYDFLLRNDGFSAGEKLTQIEKLTKKRFLYLTDKEIYEAMEQIVKSQLEEKDTPFEEDKDFAGFVEVLFKDNTKQTIFGVGTYYKD